MLRCFRKKSKSKNLKNHEKSSKNLNYHEKSSHNFDEGKFSFYYYGPEYIKEGDCVKKNPKELKSKKRRKDSAYYEFIGMSAKDAKILSRTMGTARLLDGSERHCGIKVGFGGFIGLIPAGGDLVDLTIASILVANAWRVEGHLGWITGLRMWFNVGQYFIIGLVPILGDLLDIALRRNSKNAKLLEKLLMKRLKEARGKNEIAGYVVGDSAADLDSNHPTGRVPMFPTGYADRNGERLTYNTPRPAIVAPAGRGQGYGRDGRREGPSVPLPTNHPSGQGHQKPRQGYGQPF